MAKPEPMARPEPMTVAGATRTLGDAAWWAVLVWLSPATVVARAAASCAVPTGTSAFREADAAEHGGSGPAASRPR